YGEIDLYGRNWDRMPARVGKVRTPATFRRIVGELWQVKQRYWPDPLYATMGGAAKGPARSKSKTGAQYRVSLCFGDSILKGWLPEKIFDCFFAGTVPVYWGAPDVLDWIPAECFIDMRQFKDFTELRAFLHSLTPADERRYREAAREFVGSARFTPFRLDTFADIFARIVSADIGAKV